MAQRIDEKTLLLGDLLHGIIDLAEYSRIVITGVSQDSREVEFGNLFIAIAGQASHGLAYFQQALDNGAIAILAEPGSGWDRSTIADLSGRCAVPILLIEDLSQQVGRIASRFFGCPAQAIRVIGVTGTNGKTSVSHFIANALSSHVSMGLIGTLGNGLPTDLKRATHTTPDAVHVQEELAKQQRLGVKAVAMEVSSHALDQGRVAELPFHTAVFTNLSRDHQDYHGSMLAYAEAKAKLLRRKGLMCAVINADDALGFQLLDEVKDRVMTVAVGSRDEVKTISDKFVYAAGLKAVATGLHIKFDSSWGQGEIHSRLLGRFNAENILLSLAMLLAWDMSLDSAIAELEKLSPVEGRMTQLGDEAQPKVVIDFAHTPDALENVLTSLREHTQGKLYCVFGCGGDRDQGKRAVMGKIAERLADEITITDDNRRSEDGQSIVDDILSGMSKLSEPRVIRDRAQAIAETIAVASTKDIVLIAGKGHENYQQVGDLKLPFSDLDQAEIALQGYGA